MRKSKNVGSKYSLKTLIKSRPVHIKSSWSGNVFYSSSNFINYFYILDVLERLVMSEEGVGSY